MKTLKQTLIIALQLIGVASIFALAYLFLLLGYGAGMKM